MQASLNRCICQTLRFFLMLRLTYISALTCPVLSPIEGASPSCTEENHFRSICSFNCKVGYDMPSHVSKALVCQNDKTWRKNGEPKCKGKLSCVVWSESLLGTFCIAKNCKNLSCGQRRRANGTDCTQTTKQRKAKQTAVSSTTRWSLCEGRVCV